MHGFTVRVLLEGFQPLFLGRFFGVGVGWGGVGWGGVGLGWGGVGRGGDLKVIKI